MKMGDFFLKKGPKKFNPSFSILFLSVLHQNKALHNFCKRGRRSIVERSIGLKYALISHAISLISPICIIDKGRCTICLILNPLSANSSKWSNILKQFVGKLSTTFLSVLDHFVGLALKELREEGAVFYKDFR